MGFKSSGDEAAPSAVQSAEGLSVSRRAFLATGAGLGAAVAAAPALLDVALAPALAQGATAPPMAGHTGHGQGGGHGTADPSATGTPAFNGDPSFTVVPHRAFEPGAPLVEPEVRRSVDGVLETTLRLDYVYKDVGGYRLFMRSYEGTIPGPTLRVKPGDTLKIRLVNDLPPNRDPTPAYSDQPHNTNTTNFHFHGSHVSPSGISDNVMRSMLPGQSYDIEIDIPEDHTMGTAWYHPHHHGSADIQIASGCAGAIVIEGDFAEVPEIASATERLLVLGEAVFDSFGTVEDFYTLFPETALRFFTVNGQRAPKITMRPGEVQRWRVLHAGYQDDIFLKLAGHALHPIARDGIGLSRMGTPDVRTDQVGDEPDARLIVPGQRIDFLVKAGEPGIYELSALPYDQGYPSPTGLVALLEVAGEPMPMPLPATLPPAPLEPIRDEEITGSRQLTFSAISPEVDAAGHWREFVFMIDGKTFDMNRVDQRVRLGDVEEWTIVNQHKHDHVFHIHTNPFQLTKVNGEPLADPVWLDTVVLPRFGSITFRSRFLDYTGKFMLHCHMMNHEELGMMQVVEVYSEA